ncbi:MAG: hypothetical protein ACYC9L_03075 [Sulfuricaulis sp.]
MRKLDPTQRRLCSKAYAGETAIEILLVKNAGGYTAAAVVRDAEELAELGLRAKQIQKLTSLPGCNCRHLVKKVGKSRVTGKPKMSVNELIETPVNQMLVSSFLELIERQLDLSESSKLVSEHVLAAIKAFAFHTPSHWQGLDWERLVNAGFAIEAGTLSLVTCKLCGTRHVPMPGVTGDRSCPLCRVAASITRVNSRARQPTRFVPMARKLIPSDADCAMQRRARFHAALGYSRLDTADETSPETAIATAP